MSSKINLIPLLEYIDPGACNYEEWTQVGMALKHEGYPVSVWDAWSRKDGGRYNAGECEKKWTSFGSHAASLITGATITQMAKDNGWESSYEDKALDWDAEITRELEPQSEKLIDPAWVEAQDILEPGKEWNPMQDLISYLSTIFEPDEKVGYVVESMRKEGESRFIPAGKGSYDRSAGRLIEELKHYKGDIGSALGDYNAECGAWIRFNPLDGKGVKNDNVTSYRYALIECDDMELSKQNAIIRELELPVAAMVYSGGKSIHAIVHIDAKDYEEYRQRVNDMYDICRKNGLNLDTQNKNPSRLSRLPGVYRDKHKQFLMATNIGQKDYVAWKEWADEQTDNLPDPENLASEWDNMPPLSPALIDGVLRQGHKMLLAGPSKAGKSFLLIELCLAIAEGKQWIGFNCAQGRVMYVNLELDKASCLHRFKDVYAALNWIPDNLQNIDIWNLRGKSIPMDQLAPKLIRRAKKNNYMAVIIDPIYKVITGDENSADQMAHFCNQFDKVCTELGCAVIYCHHHSKGSQGNKRAMDRASGSGVFARDPDALLDLIQLDVKGDNDSKEASTAWRIDGTLREFAKFAPVNLWFKYPVHLADKSGILKMAGTMDNTAKKGGEATKSKSEQKKALIPTAFSAAEKTPEGGVLIKDIAEFLEIAERTARDYVNKSNDYVISKGVVFEKKNVAKA